MIYNNLCPQWNEFFRVSVCHYAKRLVFRVKDQDELGTDQVGEVFIPVEELTRKPKLSISGEQARILILEANHSSNCGVPLFFLTDNHP